MTFWILWIRISLKVVGPCRQTSQRLKLRSDQSFGQVMWATIELIVVSSVEFIWEPELDVKILPSWYDLIDIVDFIL